MRRSKKYSNVYVQPRKLIITKKKKKKKYSKKGNMVMKIYTKVNKLLNSQTTWYDSDLATTVSTTGHIQPIGLLDMIHQSLITPRDEGDGLPRISE